MFFIGALSSFAGGAIAAFAIAYWGKFKHKFVIASLAMLVIWIGGYPLALLLTSGYTVTLETGVSECDHNITDGEFTEFITLVRNAEPIDEMLLASLQSQKFHRWATCLTDNHYHADTLHAVLTQVYYRQARIHHHMLASKTYKGLNSESSYVSDQNKFNRYVNAQIHKHYNSGTDIPIFVDFIPRQTSFRI